MNRDEIEGQAEALKGKIKQGVGNVTDDPRLQDEGVDQETAGNVQKAFGTAKRKAGELIEEAGKAIKK
jgi:uncharacterized protein YjbJ (UPF0337 family)